MPAEIYALLDQSGAIRYIGRTTAGAAVRRDRHWTQRNRGNRARWAATAWLKTLAEPPAVRVLVIAETDDAEIENEVVRAAQQRWPGQLLNVRREPTMFYRAAEAAINRSDYDPAVKAEALRSLRSRKFRLR